ncbi:MAG TPA: MFS transporter [Flavobacteriales bacterium]|nr:MFS transporter [Flavobacteriales bacterium]HIB76221.1 MFS transporter [Flavobacteriales bacterium]
MSTVMFMASFGMMLPELPGYLNTMGAGHLIGYIVGLFTLGALVSRLFSGKIADKAGRRVVMLIGTAVTAIAGFCYVLLGYISGLDFIAIESGMLAVWLFLGLRFFHGLSTGFRPAGSSALLTDIVPVERRGEALGFLGVAGNAGMAGGPAIGSLLAVEWGYDSMFIASSLLGIASLLITLKLPETLPGARPIKRSDLNVFKGKNFERAAWPAAISLLPVALAFGVFLTITPDFVEDLGYKYKGLFNTIVVVASISMRFVAGKASDKYGRVPILAIGGILLFLGMGILSYATTQFTAVIGGVIYGLSIGVNMPTIFAWTADLAPKGKIALAIGTTLVALEIGIGFGAFVSGSLFSSDATWLPLLYRFCSATGMIMAVVLFVFRKNKSTTIN